MLSQHPILRTFLPVTGNIAALFFVYENCKYVYNHSDESNTLQTVACAGLITVECAVIYGTYKVVTL